MLKPFFYCLSRCVPFFNPLLSCGLLVEYACSPHVCMGHHADGQNELQATVQCHFPGI